MDLCLCSLVTNVDLCVCDSTLLHVLGVKYSQLNPIFGRNVPYILRQTSTNNFSAATCNVQVASSGPPQIITL